MSRHGNSSDDPAPDGSGSSVPGPKPGGARRGPRLRFAPSPTGSLHVGNARTALVNWLVARRQQGRLLLRIEDTDVERSSSASESAIVEDLRWLGLDWDEGPGHRGEHGPYRQSERRGIHDAAVDTLLETGAAYPCFCDPDELEDLRRAARRRGEGFRYPGTCRDLSEEQRRRGRQDRPPAIRFAVPPDREVSFVDGLRGKTGVPAGEIGDFVIRRADGSPTYNLAVVADDRAMEIDHVIRGEDHLANTPRQVLIFEALGVTPPRYTHLSLVLGGDGAPLSKRHGSSSLASLRRSGILPVAICNHLALLGWTVPEEGEVMGREELVERFRLQELSAAAVVFDPDKLEWLNARHLSRLAPRELLEVAEPYLESAGIELPEAGPAREWWGELLELLRPRCPRLDRFAEALRPLLQPEWTDEVRDELDDESARAVLEAFAAVARRGMLVDDDGFRAAAARVSEQTGARGRALYHPLRLALTGREAGPELAALVPLLERGAALDEGPGVAGVAARLEAVLEGDPAS